LHNVFVTPIVGRPKFGTSVCYGFTDEENEYDNKILRINDLCLGKIRISIATIAATLGYRAIENELLSHKVCARFLAQHPI